MPAGDQFKKVRSGDKLRIPATTYNAFIDTTMELRRRGQNTTSESSPSFRQSGIIKVKNCTGQNRKRFDVLGISDPIFLPRQNENSFKNHVMFDGVVPVGPNHKGKFVILLEPLKAGAIGMACIDGVCPAKISTQSNNLKYADIKNNDASMLAADESGGAQVLWLDSATQSGGSKWAIVRIGFCEPSTTTLLKLNKAYTLNNPSLGKKMPGGIYSAVVMGGEFDPATFPPPSSADLAMPQGLAAPDGGPSGSQLPEVYWVNLDEDAQENTHNLDMDTPCYVYGWPRGATTAGIPIYFGFCVRGATLYPENLPDPNVEAAQYAIKDQRFWRRWNKPKQPHPLDKGGSPIDLNADLRTRRASQFQSINPAISTAQDLRLYRRHVTIDAQGRFYEIKEEAERTELTLPDYAWDIAPAQGNWSPTVPAGPAGEPPAKPKSHTMCWTLAGDRWVRAIENEIEVIEWKVFGYPNPYPLLRQRQRNVYGFVSQGEPTEWTTFDVYKVKVDGNDSQPDYLDIKLFADETWIEKKKENNTLTFNHIGPDDKSFLPLYTVSSAGIGVNPQGTLLTIVVNSFDLRRDSKGHVDRYGDIRPLVATCPLVEVEVITDLQIGTGYIQCKKRKIKVLAADAESGWLNLIQTTDCPQ